MIVISVIISHVTDNFYYNLPCGIVFNNKFFILMPVLKNLRCEVDIKILQKSAAFINKHLSGHHRSLINYVSFKKMTIIST